MQASEGALRDCTQYLELHTTQCWLSLILHPASHTLLGAAGPAVCGYRLHAPCSAGGTRNGSVWPWGLPLPNSTNIRIWHVNNQPALCLQAEEQQ